SGMHAGAIIGNVVAAAVATFLSLVVIGAAPPRSSQPPIAGACFLLLDTKSGEFTRNPDQVCGTPLPPASTFKIPHAIAALESGVVKDANEVIAYDGRP